MGFKATGDHTRVIFEPRAFTAPACAPLVARPDGRKENMMLELTTLSAPCFFSPARKAELCRWVLISFDIFGVYFCTICTYVSWPDQSCLDYVTLLYGAQASSHRVPSLVLGGSVVDS